MENKNEKNFEVKHYQKINILGDAGVGKSSLISLIEKYNDDDFQIVNKDLSQTQMSIESYNNSSSSLVEQIKRVDIFNIENKNLYLNLYETNLDNYDYIKMNLDTLLLQTECIIIMWDKSRPETFDNIPNLISTIIEGIKEYKFRDVPIFLIQNKIDLNINDLSNSLINEFKNNNNSIEKIKKGNKNIIYKEISLLEKDNFNDLIKEIDKNMNIYKEKQKNLNDVVNMVKFNLKEKNLLKNDDDDNNILINIILLGESFVGKTTLFNYFFGKKNKNFVVTKGIESLIIDAEINKEKIKIQLFDTAGQERFHSISQKYIREAHGVLLLFDVTNKESFDTIEQWISEIKELNNIDIILIGNKIDKIDKRVISKKKAKEKANKYNLKYFESCCLNGLNLYEILNEIIFLGYYQYFKNPSTEIRKKTIKINTKTNNKQNTKNRKCCK